MGVLAVTLAALSGAILGLVAHVSYLILDDQASGPLSALRAQTGIERDLFVLGGAVLTLLVVSAASGMLSLRNVLRDIAGATFGAGAGFLLYVLGYLSAGAAAHGNASWYALRYWAALDTLTVTELAAAILGAVVGLIVIRFRWKLYGVIAYVAFVSIVAGYFAYVFNVALPRVPAQALPFSLLLLWAEGMSLAMVVIHTFYGLDNFVKTRWDRTPDRVPFGRHYMPRVALHYACFNEPPEIVFDALSRFKELDYPKDRYIVMVLDDSTDEKLRKPVEEYCRRNGIMYIHRTDRRG